MRSSAVLYLLFLLIAMTDIDAGLTDLDYHLGESKYADSSITEDESFHGSSSARLSVEDGGNYVRITIYLDEPMQIEDLDRLSMWVNPQQGDGNVEIEVLLDGDGDDSYSSDSSKDVQLRSIKESWSTIGMSPQQWNELDGFDLAYEKYGDEDFGDHSLDECQDALKGEKVVKIYITIYKDKSVKNTTAYIDYIKIGDHVISFEPLEKEEVKDAPKSVSPGSEITYTITYGNNLLEPVDLVIRESYDIRTSFVKASPQPDPGTNNIWTIHNLQPGKHGQIVVKVRTSKLSCKADINGKVSGKGYASASGILSTDLSGYAVTNSVMISSKKFNLTASASTEVRPVEGSTIDFDEHGAGYYSSDEQLGYSSSRIFVFSDLSASKLFSEANISLSPITSSNIYNGTFSGGMSNRSVFSGIHWQASRSCENRAKDLLMSEDYSYGDYLNLNSRAYLSKTSSYLETTSNFSGMAELLSRWKDSVYIGTFAGNFTGASEARLRENKKTKSLDAEYLGCCPEIDE